VGARLGGHRPRPGVDLAVAVFDRIRSLGRNLFRKDRVERELNEELAAAVDQLAEENAAAGLSPEEARRQARIALGGVEQVKEAVRESRAGAGLETFAQDVRYALRMLGRSAGFSAVAVTTLALGIGANTAIFTVLDATLIAPLPYADPSRLVMLWTGYREARQPRVPASGHEVLEIRRRSRELAEVAGIWVGAGSVTGEGEPERVRLALTTSNFLGIFGVPPALGRLLLPSDQGSEGSTAVVLSDGFWRRRFGGDPAVIGKAVRIDGGLVTIVGVMPAKFDVIFAGDSSVPPGIEVFTTFGRDLAEMPRDMGWIRMVARLAPGATVASAQAEVSGIAERLRAEFAEYKTPGLELQIVPLHADAVRDVRPALLALFAGVGLVVLIACANVANLLLARATGREREIGLRAALGASRGRIARQLLTESLVLSGFGALLGLLVGRLGLTALLALRPASLARLAPTGLSLTVLAFTLMLAGATGLICGLAPAVAASRRDLARALQEGGRGGSAGGRTRPQRVLVFAEVALGFLLLVGAGLLVRTFVALSGADPGFRPEATLTLQVSAQGGRYPDDASRRQLARTLSSSLGALPGVAAVGAVSHLPFDDYPNWYEYYWREGAPESERNTAMADHRAVLPGFFESLGVEIRRGRTFNDADDAAHPNVIVVDETLAKRTWGSEDPIGRRLSVSFIHEGSFDSTVAEVVGVVRHVRYRDLGADGRGQVYVPYLQSVRPELAFTLRAAPGADARSFAIDARRIVARVDPDLAVSKVRLLEDYVRQASTAARFTTVIAGALAGLALLLAGIGIYGILAYSVAQRRNEIGVRLALGGRPRDIVWLVLRQTTGLVAAGLGAGLIGSLVMTRLLQKLLYGVGPRDLGTLAAAAAVLAAVGLAAAVLPARRAVRVDPIAALRGE
jgi:putative ABC transport system permease protein